MKSVSNPPEEILILDDEPQYLEWLIEYLEAKSYRVTFSNDLADALNKLTPKLYRLIVLDLSVPVSPELKDSLKSEGRVYVEYPGLFVAHKARNIGYRDRQVVVYSVHDANPVRELSDRIGVSYITKGRPAALKREIDEILSFDPTSK